MKQSRKETRRKTITKEMQSLSEMKRQIYYQYPDLSNKITKNIHKDKAKRKFKPYK